MTIWPKGSIVGINKELTKRELCYEGIFYDVYDRRGHELAELGHDWRDHHKSILLVFRNPKEYLKVVPGILELVYMNPC